MMESEVNMKRYNIGDILTDLEEIFKVVEFYEIEWIGIDKAKIVGVKEQK